MTLTINGRRINAVRRSAPRPDAPTLVFLHEGLGSIALWRDFPQRLAEAVGAAALVYERAGFGRSDPPAEARGLDYLHRSALEELPAVLAACGIERPILVGHSDGASIALIYAALSPTPPLGIAIEAPHSFVEDVTLAGIREAVTAWETTDLPQKLGRRHDDAERVFRAWWEIWLSEPFRAWSITDLLPKITVPTLAIQGLDDEYGTPEQIHAIVRAAPGPVTPLLLPNCAHTPHRDAAEAVLAAMRAFILTLEAGGGAL